MRATDPSGNVDGSPATATFVIDRTEPVVTVSCPDTVLLNADAVATVSATDGDGGIAASDEPERRAAARHQGAGASDVHDEAIDRAGNLGSASARTSSATRTRAPRSLGTCGATRTAAASRIEWAAGRARRACR